MENLAKLISLPTRGSPAGWVIVLFGLLVTQLVLGKKGAFPYGVLLGINLYLISAIVILTDLILMIFVDQILDNTSRNFNRLKIMRSRLKKLQEWLKESSWGKKLQHLGKVGVVGITATPFAGGVWSGVTLSRILVFPRKVTFWFVGIGSVIGCGIFLVASEGLIRLV